MPNTRKQIILNEILFWKQNKLLPEHYCDFLMTLYTEGEVEPEENVSHKKAVKAKEKRNFNLFSTLLVLVALVLLVLLFTVNQLFVLFIIVISILTILSIVGAIIYTKRKNLLGPIFQIVLALFIFGLSVKISIVFFDNHPIVLFVILMINCLLWLVAGILSRLMYFTISGSLGIIVLIGYKLFFS
ncbi:hypothetical protein D7X33_37020 [Butyricicoccus sp. 1XD8-22]|nr:hypothetical protein D7X33_37020 [Butyricicoccus sp. 1XD8-22]